MEQELFLNTDNIEFIEEAPHTVVTTTAGNKFITKEKASDIIELASAYKRKIFIKEEIIKQT